MLAEFDTTPYFNSFSLVRHTRWDTFSFLGEEVLRENF